MGVQIIVNKIDINENKNIINIIEKLITVLNNGRIAKVTNAHNEEKEMHVVLATTENQEIFLNILRKTDFVVKHPSTTLTISIIDEYTLDDEKCRIYFPVSKRLNCFIELLNSYIKKEDKSIINQRTDDLLLSLID